MTAPFATELLGWKSSTKNKLDWPLVPNFADVDNAESIRIAAGVLDALGVGRAVDPAVPSAPGGPSNRLYAINWAGSLLAGMPTGNGWLAAVLC